MEFREFEDLANYNIYHGVYHIGSSLLPSGLVKIMDSNSPPMSRQLVSLFLVFDMCIFYLSSLIFLPSYYYSPCFIFLSMHILV
jgi:hypothetical protein